jgi:hypothetical protein
VAVANLFRATAHCFAIEFGSVPREDRVNVPSKPSSEFPPKVGGATHHSIRFAFLADRHNFHLKESFMRRGTTRNIWNRFEQQQNALLRACFNEKARDNCA